MAQAAGAAGMLGGQMIDLAAEHKAVDVELIAMIERMKTGALISFSCEGRRDPRWRRCEIARDRARIRL